MPNKDTHRRLFDSVSKKKITESVARSSNINSLKILKQDALVKDIDLKTKTII